MNNKIPGISPPYERELDRMVNSLERRVMIIGRDQRTFSGVFNPQARLYFILGFLVALMLVILGIQSAR